MRRVLLFAGVVLVPCMPCKFIHAIIIIVINDNHHHHQPTPPNHHADLSTPATPTPTPPRTRHKVLEERDAHGVLVAREGGAEDEARVDRHQVPLHPRLVRVLPRSLLRSPVVTSDQIAVRPGVCGVRERQ
jgi:hypothetical protein